MLDIYKASAGSGKTFALTLAYFRIIFEMPLEYRHILAVTFTNKATEEMKSRIINELHRLAEGVKSDYGEILKQELQLNDEQLKQKAVLLRNILLHDYGRLAVTTIDRFFQRILKAFTRELGIFPSYNIELDSDYVLLKAADKMMRQLDKDPELRTWVNDLMNSNVEEGKSWNVRSKIVELGEELFKENYMLFDEQILEKFERKTLLKNYREFLSNKITEFEQHLTDIAERALSTEVELSDFKGGKNSCANWLYKLKAGNFDPPTAPARKNIENRNCELKSSSGRSDILERVLFGLEKALAYYDAESPKYLAAKQLKGSLYQLGILHDLYKEVRTYCDEKNLMLLSDTTSILNQLIANNETSFLFEKFGNYYKHLMIDEFQDTSTMQWNNFRPLVVNSLGEGAKTMIVGDVKQSIYRWRNGDWGLLAYGLEDEFRKLGVNQVVLQDNWRSAKEIVEFNNDFFEKAVHVLADLYVQETDEEGRKNLILEAYQGLRQNPRKQKQGYVDIAFGIEKKEEHADQTILKEITYILEEIFQRGGRAQDVVILVRNSKEGALIADYLIEYNKTSNQAINFISNDSLYVSFSPYVQFIVAVLRYMIEPYDLVNKATILYIYNTFIQLPHKDPDDYLPLLREENIWDLFRLDDKVGVSFSLYETIENIIDGLKLKDNPQEVPYLIAFQDIIHEYESTNSNSITLFLEWWDKEQHKRVLTTSEEVDAVKILTIHKSKGLEFEYVILPFCDWELDCVLPQRWLWCSNREKGFDTLDYAPLNYSSKLMSTSFREDYLDEHVKAFIDNLNLLYVALTRAKTELYLRPYAPSKNKDGKIVLSEMGGFIWKVLKELGVEDPLETVFTKGEPQRIVLSDNQQTTTLSLNHYPIWTPQERIQVKLRYKDYVDPTGLGLSAIDEGKLLHEIFKSIESMEGIEQAVQQAYLSGVIQKEEREKYIAKITDYLKIPEAATWFSTTCSILNEKEILFPSGQKFRPDRVIILPDGKVQVIDYKFGQHEESKYLKQVRFYCDTLRKMGYKKVEGFIWYVKLEKIVSV